MSGPPPLPWAGEPGLPFQRRTSFPWEGKSEARIQQKTKGVVLAWGLIYNPP